MEMNKKKSDKAVFWITVVTFFSSMVFIFSACNKNESLDLHIENKSIESTLPHISISADEFGRIHNELLDNFYKTESNLRSSENRKEYTLNEYIDLFIDKFKPVMEKYFDLDTISVPIESLRLYLRNEMKELSQIHFNYGLDSVELYLHKKLQSKNVDAPLVNFSKNSELRLATGYNNFDNKETLEHIKLYNSTLHHSNLYWNGEFRVSGGTKAIVADAAFGVLAWSLGPWSIVAAGFASSMVNEGEQHCTHHSSYLLPSDINNPKVKLVTTPEQVE